ncbi:radial spoke head 1 homolog [Stegodyphus dumicola]|uniref:radial spoke head 1 homolog n=1 Tax=Stegodyphus dumicola TaxID=202533 RepID=UPI0015B12866|nr:radial spoke head 1 homolog [Stegodyphus dumicola]
MSEESVDTTQDLGFYEGERQRGLRHGFGMYVFPSGARYTGYWRKGLRHGIGTFIYPDGSRYEGAWWENKKHGHGRYTYSNGDMYDGMWCLDKKQGYGLYCDEANRFYYKGYFADGTLNGPVQVLMNNIYFFGNFIDGKPSGQGNYSLPNGLLIRGEFKLYGPKKIPLWVTKSVSPAFLTGTK